MPKRARVTFTTKDVDRGWKRIREVAKRVGEGKSYVKVGVLGKKAREKTDGKVDTVTLAFLHEFGAPGAGIPERSFIRATFDQNRAKYRALVKKLVAQMLRDKTMTEKKALGIIGATMAADVKRYVTQGAGVPPPNAPATLRRKLKRTRKGSKGQPRTLIDTGRMVASVTYEVTAGGTKTEG